MADVRNSRGEIAHRVRRLRWLGRPDSQPAVRKNRAGAAFKRYWNAASFRVARAAVIIERRMTERAVTAVYGSGSEEYERLAALDRTSLTAGERVEFRRLVRYYTRVVRLSGRRSRVLSLGSLLLTGILSGCAIWLQMIVYRDLYSAGAGRWQALAITYVVAGVGVAVSWSLHTAADLYGRGWVLTLYYLTFLLPLVALAGAQKGAEAGSIGEQHEFVLAAGAAGFAFATLLSTAVGMNRKGPDQWPRAWVRYKASHFFVAVRALDAYLVWCGAARQSSRPRPLNLHQPLRRLRSARRSGPTAPLTRWTYLVRFGRTRSSRKERESIPDEWPRTQVRHKGSYISKARGALNEFLVRVGATLPLTEERRLRRRWRVGDQIHAATIVMDVAHMIEHDVAYSRRSNIGPLDAISRDGFWRIAEGFRKAAADETMNAQAGRSRFGTAMLELSRTALSGQWPPEKTGRNPTILERGRHLLRAFVPTLLPAGALLLGSIYAWGGTGLSTWTVVALQTVTFWTGLAGVTVGVIGLVTRPR